MGRRKKIKEIDTTWVPANPKTRVLSIEAIEAIWLLDPRPAAFVKNLREAIRNLDNTNPDLPDL